MKPFPHTYTARLSGAADGCAVVSSVGLPELRVAPPKDFDGPGDTWSPEHLLLAAIETCFLFTFQAVARASKFEFTSVELSAKGTVDHKNGVTSFTRIVLCPTVRLPARGDRDKAMRMLEKSERACLVAASLATPIQLKPEIVVG